MRSAIALAVVVGYLAVGMLFYLRFETNQECASICKPPETRGVLDALRVGVLRRGAKETCSVPEPGDCAWSVIDAFYFSVVTMSTVGYGDMSPSSNMSQAFTIVYILVGIIVVFPLIAMGVQRIFDPLFELARRPFERVFPPEYIDIDGDGVFNFEMPSEYAAEFYAKNLMPPIIVILLFQLLSTAILVSIEEELTPWMGFYHCMVTATTVGYGDVAIQTRTGRLCAAIHILLSVAILGALIGDIDGLREKRAQSLMRAEQLKRKLDPELIKKLDKTGGGVDRLDFLVGTLVHLEVIPQEEIDAYLKQFAKLDVNGDGKLSSADLVGLQTDIKKAHPVTVQKLRIPSA